MALWLRAPPNRANGEAAKALGGQSRTTRVYRARSRARRGNHAELELPDRWPGGPAPGRHDDEPASARSTDRPPHAWHALGRVTAVRGATAEAAWERPPQRGCFILSWTPKQLTPPHAAAAPKAQRWVKLLCGVKKLRERQATEAAGVG